MGREKRKPLGPLAMLSAPTEGGPADQRRRAPPKPKRTRRVLNESERASRMERLRRANKKLAKLRSEGLMPPRRTKAMIEKEKRDARGAAVRAAKKAVKAAQAALDAPPPPSGPISIVVEADTGKFGPAMLALPNDRWRKYVFAIIHQGGREMAKAYRAAGFEVANAANAAQGAHRLSRDPRIQAAIREETWNEMNATLLPAATKRIGGIIDDPEAKDADALKAAMAVWDRTGFHEVSEQKVSVAPSIGDPQQLERIRLKFEQLGLGPEAFNKAIGARLAALVPPPEITDAEYVEEGSADGN